MSVVLSTAMERAQQALNGGDYRGAVETCNRIVAQFPTFAAAYRLLGEAQLEQGQAADAERAFAQALVRDPRQAEAYLGLGLIAEERGVLESSLAYCQVAWELAPHQPHFREPVVRVAGRRFGGDGYLQLTHAALAQLHLNAARLHRAANEYQTALVELPDRIDLWIGLAVAFWRLGQDDDAAEISREFLAEHPELGQALVILIDIEHRRGNDDEALRLREQLRRVDADGELAAAMVATNPRAASDFLLLSDDEMPALDERARQVANEMPQIAPAPDFDYQPPVPEPTGAAGLGLAAAVGAAGAMLGATDDEVDLDAELAGLTPMTAEEFGGEPDAEAFSLDDTSVHAFTVDELDQSDLPRFEAVDDLDLEARPEYGAADIDELMLGLEGLEPIDAAEFDEALLAEGSVADDVLSAEQTPSPDVAQPAEEDALVDLARALEVDVAVALARAGEPVETPPEAVVPPGTGYTTLLSELGDEGHTPFDPARAAQAASAAYDAGERGDELASLTDGWDDLDAEIASAVPVSTGETDELLAMSDIDMAPFSLDEFATDELAGSAPVAGMAPAPADVVPVPSADSLATGAAALDPADNAPEAAFVAEDEYLEGIEPFSVEEFDDLDDVEFSFGKLPWETGDDASALPSDADLDAMLADASLPELTPDVPALDDRDALLAGLDAQELGEPDSGSRTEDAELPLLETALTDVPAESPPYDLVGADELDASLAVTRELGTPAVADDDFAARLAAMEAAAALNLEQFDAPGTAVDDELDAAAAHKPLTATDLFPTSDPERLVSDRHLFDRSRAAKDEMVAEGVIVGDLELVNAPAGEVAEPDEHAMAQEQDARSRPPDAPTTPPSRDVETLLLSLEAAPEDDELHWWLAEALREQGDARAAMNEYRWLIRNAPQRHGQVTDALQLCVERQQDPELAYRLLSDAYRRHGDTQKASAHAALAMAERRKTR